MTFRPLLVLVSLALMATALSGCFGGSADAETVRGEDLPPLEVTLFLKQIMFHPYPGGMLSAWMYTENFQLQDGTMMDFEPPVIRAKEGQTVRITFSNTHGDGLNHTIHWHGLHVPWDMDGVPYVSQQPVQAGEEFTYEFVATPAGTHFFHCHVDTPHHMDMGMYGVFIVEPNGEDPYPYDSEYTMVLDDWDSTHLHQSGGGDPQMTVDSTVDDSGDPFNQVERTQQQARDMYNNPPQYVEQQQDLRNPLRAQRDWYPETYAPWQPVYDTWTINGKSYPLTEPVPIKEGETKKIRFINVGNTIFSMHLHGHHFQVTHTDGYPLDAPYMKDTLLIGPGERYDILIEGNNPGPWMMHDHMGLHEMNDHISPGGMMTMLMYEGFEHGAGADDHSGHEANAGSSQQILRMDAGDFLGLYR